MLHGGSPQRGLTLVEVILVLALLVVIGAVSAPLLEGAFSRSGLQSAADVLRGAWAKARLAAIRSGQTHVFRFEPSGSRFQIVPLNELGLPESNELEADNPDVAHKPVDMLRISRNRLPAGIVFAAGDASSSNQLFATLPNAAEGPWSPPILFRPDGTTSDAFVVLSNERQSTIRVTLRGLTGVSNTTESAGDALP